MTKFRHHPGHPLADESGWVELNDAYWANLPEFDSCGKPYNNSDKSFNVISDIMDPARHMCDGKLYDSKSEFRRITKQHGCVEVGNDPSIMNPKPRQWKAPDKRERVEHLRQAIHELKNGRR